MKMRMRLKDYYVTIIILLVLLGVFLTETFLGGSENNSVLLSMGAMSNYLVVAASQWWRLFTAQFLHVGILHLATNAVVFYYLGQYLEPMMGHVRFLLVYLLAGVGGNLCSLAFGDDRALAAGASTAIFGLCGAMVAIGLRNRNNGTIAFLGRQALVLALINLAFDLFVPGIDLQGHLGGLLSGFLLTVLFGDRLVQKYDVKWRVLAGACLIFYVAVTVRMGMVINF